MNLPLLLFALLTQSHVVDKQIGQVGGRPVYESEVKGASEQEREQSLRALFVAPAMKSYMDPYKSQWELTDQDIEALVHAYRESLKCKPDAPKPNLPDFDRFFAKFLGTNLKIQRFIYMQNGHGRILFQQAGPEAFDATRNLLLKLEKEGSFAINDPTLREKTLKYWLNDHQSGLFEDPGPDKAFALDQAFAKCPRG